MRNFLCLALALAGSTSAFAQVTTGEFFGMTPSDMQAAMMQAKADDHMERLKNLGWQEHNFAGVGRFIGTTLKPASQRNCVIDAVITKMGVTIRFDTEWPDVLMQSETDKSRYDAAVKAQYPNADVSKFKTVYLSNYNATYVADATGAYADGAAMDAAIAGTYARFIDGTQKNVSDAAKLDQDASDVSAWYAKTYPAGKTSCAY